MNALSGKVEKNLEAARATIDTLDMFKAKTKGNLSKQEEELLQNWLTNLRLNYVDEMKQQQKEAEEKKSAEKTVVEESEQKPEADTQEQPKAEQPSETPKATSEASKEADNTSDK